jgi:hypothetical protein
MTTNAIVRDMRGFRAEEVRDADREMHAVRRKQEPLDRAAGLPGLLRLSGAAAGRDAAAPG